jgi:hypothetical protein
VKITTPILIRWAGLAALAAGLCYTAVGVLHPANEAETVTSAAWISAHVLAMGTSFLGLFGLTGLYARQAEKSGWVGLAGYLLLSLWLALILGFTFVEVLILPALAAASPVFVAAWLGLFNGATGGLDLGALSFTWTLTAPLYILGGLLFGIATFRARILSRWAAALLALGAVIGPLAALVPLDWQPKAAIPVGIALAWLGYSLWSERRSRTLATPAALTPAAS